MQGKSKVGDLGARVCITGYILFKVGDNTFVNAVMNISDNGKQRIFSFGQVVSLSVFKEMFFLSEAIKLISALH